MAEQQAPVKYRINTVTACFMVVFAAVADLLQVLLNLSAIFALGADLVTFVAEGVLGVWFLICGISYVGGKKGLSNILTVFGTTIIELVPVLDALPTLTIGTILIIRNSRIEDRSRSEVKPARKASAGVSKIRL